MLDEAKMNKLMTEYFEKQGSNAIDPAALAAFLKKKGYELGGICVALQIYDPKELPPQLANDPLVKFTQSM